MNHYEYMNIWIYTNTFDICVRWQMVSWCSTACLSMPEPWELVRRRHQEPLPNLPDVPWRCLGCASDWKCLGLLDHVGPKIVQLWDAFFCHKATNNRIEMAKDRNPKYAMHRGKVWPELESREHELACTQGRTLQLLGGSSVAPQWLIIVSYPLVNVYIAMENHHV